MPASVSPPDGSGGGAQQLSPVIEPRMGSDESDGATSPTFAPLGTAVARSPSPPHAGRSLLHGKRREATSPQARAAAAGEGLEGPRRRTPAAQEREEFVHPPENFAMMHKGTRSWHIGSLSSPPLRLPLLPPSSCSFCAWTQPAAAAAVASAGVYRGIALANQMNHTQHCADHTAQLLALRALPAGSFPSKRSLLFLEGLRLKYASHAPRSHTHTRIRVDPA
jgi:hypothetical protein